MQQDVNVLCYRGFYVDKSEEDIQPVDQVSLNPNSKYYKYRTPNNSVPKRVYPPHKIYRASEFCFPEPVNYDNDFYYNNGLINKIYYSDFRYDNNHQLKFQIPDRMPTPSQNIIYKQDIDRKINSCSNIFGDNLMNTFRLSNEMKQAEKSKLYSNLFFMK